MYYPLDAIKTKQLKHKYIYILSVFISLGSCIDNEEGIKIDRFISPNFEGKSLLFEYDNSNKAAYPVKYLLITKDSVLEEVYHYIFYDDQFNLLSGFKEKRGNESIELVEMVVLEPSNDRWKIRHLSTTGWKIPNTASIGEDWTFEKIWSTDQGEAINFSYKSERRLIDIQDKFKYLNRTVPAITFETEEKTVLSSSRDILIQSYESRTTMIYGEGVGLMEVNIVTSTDSKTILKLAKVYRGESLQEIVESNHLSEIKI